MRITNRLIVLIGLISLSGCDSFGSKTIYLICKGKTVTQQYSKQQKELIEFSYPNEELGVVIKKNKVSLSGNGSISYPKEMKICESKEVIKFSDDCENKLEEKKGNINRLLYTELENSGEYNQVLKKITLFHQLRGYDRKSIEDEPKLTSRSISTSEFKCELTDIK